MAKSRDKDTIDASGRARTFGLGIQISLYLLGKVSLGKAN
jgi:hypothetical protein